MHRPDHSTADPDAIVVGVPGYTEGDPLAIPAVPRTIVTADHVNDIGESLCLVVEGSGRTLVKSDYNQLVDAVLGGMDKICASENTSVTVSSATNAIARNTNGTIVRVGPLGSIQTSTNLGQTWTTRTAAGGYTGTFRAAQNLGATLAIAGDDGAFQYSNDEGVTWTANNLPSPSGRKINALGFQAGTLVAVGQAGGGCMVATTSSVGVAWTIQTAPIGFELLDIAPGAAVVGNFVAVGEDDGGSALFAHSSNGGVTWTDISIAGPRVRRIGYSQSGQRFIATGNETTPGNSKIWASNTSTPPAFFEVQPVSAVSLYWGALTVVDSAVFVSGKNNSGAGRTVFGVAHVNDHEEECFLSVTVSPTANTPTCSKYIDRRVVTGFNGTEVMVSLPFAHRRF